MMRIFDWLFVDQLLHTNERGETVYYPHGQTARGYVVPPERERSLRNGLRWLVVVSQVGVLALIVLVPRLIESWLGFEIPLPWFLGGALATAVIIIAAIIYWLRRLTVGLAPVSTGG